MRRSRLMVLFSFLLLASTFVYYGGFSEVKASPDIWQGNLILPGNNVTTIEGRFDINGSIIVEENATLILENALLNLTQASERQFNITFRNAVNGNPRLLAYNSTIASAFDLEFLIYLNENSTATINNSTVLGFLRPADNSALTLLNSSYIYTLFGYDSSLITVYNSTLREWHNYDSPQVEVYDSRINGFNTGSTSVNCTILNLQAGNMSYWNFLTNCSVAFISGGYCPNVTLVNTRVDWWRFGFYGSSNALLINSTIGEASVLTGSSIINLTKSRVYYLHGQASCVMSADDSLVGSLSGTGASTAWLLNTTYNFLNLYDAASVYVRWHLDLHVVDSISQDVPSANVTVMYPNATTAESKSTDANGWARLALTEKMINASGEYPIGDYTIEAVYETYSNSTTMSMIDNQMITLMLPDLVIPEFPSFLIPLLFMMATLLAVSVYKKKAQKNVSQNASNPLSLFS